jgi:hypothetical protein
MKFDKLGKEMDVSIGGKQAPKETVAAVEEPQKVAAPVAEKVERVEVVEDAPVGPDRVTICGDVIAPKYPNMIMKWPHRDDVKHGYKGWKMLRMIKGGTDVEEVKTFEEAEHTSATVLCWRSRKLDKIHCEPDEIRRKQLNQFIASDPQGVKQANGLLREIAAEGLTAHVDGAFVDRD